MINERHTGVREENKRFSSNLLMCPSTPASTPDQVEWLCGELWGRYCIRLVKTEITRAGSASLVSRDEKMKHRGNECMERIQHWLRIGRNDVMICRELARQWRDEL